MDGSGISDPGSLCSFGEATGTQSGRSKWSKWFATMGSCEDHWETRATSQMARCLGFILATSKHGLRYESLECLDKCLRAWTAIMAGRSAVAGMLRRWSLLWCRSFPVSRLQVNHPKGDQDSIPDVVSSKSCESTCSSQQERLSSRIVFLLPC